ncbi:glycosyltransferase family 2 protein [Weissella confusa]|uniref:glycosyltransferase family 2 protein n=1 Tax=Weissella confusa TaxID=1583 RepID=UPI0021BF934D|nr:glycosyltransferase family 2 protein [Weissella confusa]MCT8392500.1 glycosyltransferase family 2 protein [Weissella confusa]
MQENQNMNYKLSVVVPAYNVSEFIEDSVNSLSFFLSRKDVQVLIIDDGSTDGTSEAVRRLTRKFPQIVAYEKPNGGLSDARNFGLTKSVGEYVYFFDSDDYLTTQIQRQILDKIISSNPDLLHFGFLKIQSISETGQYNKSTSSQAEFTHMKSTDYLMEMLGDDDSLFNGYAPTKVFKRAKIHNLRFQDMNYEDLPFVVEYILKNESLNIWVSDEVGYYYLQRSNSITHQPSLKNLKDKMLGFSIVRQLLMINNVDYSIRLNNDYRTLIGTLWVASLNRTLKYKDLNREIINQLWASRSALRGANIYLRVKYIYYYLINIW